MANDVIGYRNFLLDLFEKLCSKQLTDAEKVRTARLMVQNMLNEEQAGEESRMIFVFGSNLAGRHGAGAALHARKNYGAVYGQGEGLQGNAYAIPTKDGRLMTLPLASIARYVNTFVAFAAAHPELQFLVTRIGCGLAGYKDADIAPLFKAAHDLANVKLPEGW